MINSELDDAISKLVEETFETVREKTKGKPISKSQLNALASQAESFGADGFGKIVRKRLDLNKKNDEAYKAKKGTKRSQNPEFWSTLPQVITKLDELAAKYGQKDAVFITFSRRLAVEFMYKGIA